MGVIGAGNMGKNHIRLIREMNNLFDLRAVYDPDSERINMIGAGEYSVNSIEKLLDASDAVIIAAPSSLHKEIALEVGNAGKHLLVEKPLALSEKDAKEIFDKYEGMNRVLMVGHVERFNGAILELEKILEDEKILALNMERCSSMDLRISDTDVVYDLMIHDIDILLHSVMPTTKISKIVAFGRKAYSSNYMDYVQSIITFKDETIASIVCSRATENKIRKMTIHCEKSYIVVDLLNKSIDIYRKTQLKNMGKMPTAYRQENVVERVFVPNNEPLKVELQHFYDCIEKKEKCKTDASTAIESITVLDKIKNIIYE